MTERVEGDHRLLHQELQDANKQEKRKEGILLGDSMTAKGDNINVEKV